MAEKKTEEQLSLKQQLDAMPKRNITIPDDPQNPSDKVVPVVWNGEIYTIPRGVPVDVPYVIAEIWQDSYTRTRAVNQRIDSSVNQEIKVM